MNVTVTNAVKNFYAELNNKDAKTEFRSNLEKLKESLGKEQYAELSQSLTKLIQSGSETLVKGSKEQFESLEKSFEQTGIPFKIEKKTDSISLSLEPGAAKKKLSLLMGVGSETVISDLVIDKKDVETLRSNSLVQGELATFNEDIKNQDFLGNLAAEFLGVDVKEATKSELS